MRKKEYIKKFGIDAWNIFSEKERERSRKYYKTNKKKINQKHKLYRKNNKKKEEERHHKYYVEHRDEILERGKEHQLKNKGKRKIYSKQYYEEHKEQHQASMKKWYLQNSVRILIYRKEYQKKNKEKIKKYQKEYSLKNKENIRKRNKEYYKKHRMEILEYSRNYQKQHPDKTIAKVMRHNGKGFIPLTEPLDKKFNWHHITSDLPYVIAVPIEIHKSNLHLPEHYSDINGKWLVWAANHPEAKLK